LERSRQAVVDDTPVKRRARAPRRLAAFEAEVPGGN
jgi:hypothetical protein